MIARRTGNALVSKYPCCLSRSDSKTTPSHNTVLSCPAQCDNRQMQTDCLRLLPGSGPSAAGSRRAENRGGVLSYLANAFDPETKTYKEVTSIPASMRDRRGIKQTDTLCSAVPYRLICLSKLQLRPTRRVGASEADVTADVTGFLMLLIKA
jgi:hypothetical protein